MSKNSEYDSDRNGIIDEVEIMVAKKIKEEARKDKTSKSQRKMAWVSMIFMILFTCVIMSPLVPDTRVEVLSGLLGTIYIAQAGVVGAYMGFSIIGNKDNDGDDERY